MTYYFDEFGFLSEEPIEGRTTQVAPTGALEAPARWRWDGFGWYAYVEPIIIPEPAPTYTKLTRRAFQERFPLTSNGVSRKYDRMDLFLRDDGYAASLGVTGSGMYELRELIVTGINRLNASTHVDFSMPDAANFLYLLTLPSIPAAFRLTAAERQTMLETPISESERFTGV
jgi:hypothetical protein